MEMLAAIKANRNNWQGFDILDKHLEERLFDWITLQNNGLLFKQSCQHCQSPEKNIYLVVLNENNAPQFFGETLPIDGFFEIILNRNECLTCGQIDIEGELYLY